MDDTAQRSALNERQKPKAKLGPKTNVWLALVSLLGKRPFKVRATLLATLLIGSAPPAWASFHLWDVNEVYTNGDGSVQFVELFASSNGQQFLADHELISTNAAGAIVATYVFPSDSSSPTGDRTLLIATAGFAESAGVTPDFELPANFVSADGGSVELEGADTLSFSAFTADETQSYTDAGLGDATPQNFAGETGSIVPIDPNVSLLASLLPASRSVQVGDTATVFATVINAGTAIGRDCAIESNSGAATSFSYQTTDSNTNALTGNLDAPTDIAGGNASQSFLIALTPTAAFGSTDIAFRFYCANGGDAPVFSGLNTLLLSASDTPIPDVVALAATATEDGVLSIMGNAGAGAFATASVNVGSAGAMIVTADTGDAILPVTISLCQSDPVTALCINPTTPADSVALTIGAGETPTFSLFVSASAAVAFDPAGSRVFVRFTDAGATVRGSTSVAVRTVTGR